MILIGITAPLHRSEAQPTGLANRTVFLERTFAENVDLGAPGSSVGDLRATSGVVRATQNGEVIGSYATSQTTVTTGLDGGNEQRSVMMEITIGRSDITMASFYVVPAGGPPALRVVHPIIGGTGRFLGANGSLTLIPISATEYRAELKFVPRR
jgi:hypothetical protein